MQIAASRLRAWGAHLNAERQGAAIDRRSLFLEVNAQQVLSSRDEKAAAILTAEHAVGRDRRGGDEAEPLLPGGPDMDSIASGRPDPPAPIDEKSVRNAMIGITEKTSI